MSFKLMNYRNLAQDSYFNSALEGQIQLINKVICNEKSQKKLPKKTLGGFFHVFFFFHANPDQISPYTQAKSHSIKYRFFFIFQAIICSYKLALQAFRSWLWNYFKVTCSSPMFNIMKCANLSCLIWNIFNSTNVCLQEH